MIITEDEELVMVKPKRGIVTDKEELESWLKTPEFPLLPSRGQEAFLRYLRGNYYQEDKDITDIDVKAEGMTDNAKRYQFWLKCQRLDLGNLFALYICDDETNVPDVNTFFGKYKDREDVKDKSPSDILKEKLSSAQKLDKFILELKDIMRPDLDQDFAKFKEYLEKEYGKNGEKIK
ncbi:uncharacterized protein [Panulirus ornatus]|uniref:uncharacterized protein isoform X2 n=1 Tax=Panulirus ornatus TaxID=150431 RepID=UPI003A896953